MTPATRAQAAGPRLAQCVKCGEWRTLKSRARARETGKCEKCKFPTDAEKFEAKLDRSGPGTCWLWMGSVNPGGYGQSRMHGKYDGAHRVSYRLFKGEIPDGYQVDHLCKVRHCVNPDHLEAVTPRVNNLRSESITALNAQKARCARGHLFSEANTSRAGVGRRCRQCQRDKNKAAWALIREARGPRTHCKAGHELTPKNLFIDRKNSRRCRTCANERQRAYQQRKRAAA